MRYILILAGLFILSCGAKNLAIPLYETKYQDCPFYFQKQGMCAAVEWMKKPVGIESEYKIYFWEKGANRGPYRSPGVEVNSELVMTCCGTPSRAKEKKEVEPGVFLFSRVSLMKGKWNLHIKLGDEDLVSLVVVE
jgi:hypothetical protein